MRRVLGAALAASLLLGMPAAHAGPDDCPQAVLDVRGEQPTAGAIAARLDYSAWLHDVPPVVLKAIAYVESGWRQFHTADGSPVVSSGADDVCGLGIMQVTADGYPAEDQVRLAADYAFNIDEGARILRAKWEFSLTTPPPAGAQPDDPTVVDASKRQYPVEASPRA